ncbi:TetR/AcrR family transcriptional regulator [Streptomyces sp. NPDC056653]|uniref:TetR/AcrR family transcriptional regulator n=1 Tax=Streptomyces sp. NPDC056653 TaxID=3345894 RepID=UPI00367FDB8D
MSDHGHRTPSEAETPATPGRKRSEAARLAILAATRDLIEEHGYEKLSIAGIAARAGVGKDTIYRWWPSKSMVVVDAVLLEDQPFHTAPLARTASVDQDVRDWVHTVTQDYMEPAGASRVRALTAAASEDPATAQMLYGRYTQVQRIALVDRLREAAEAGELRPDADFAAVADAVLASLLYWVTTRRTDLQSGSADPLLDVLLRGLRP